MKLGDSTIGRGVLRPEEVSEFLRLAEDLVGLSVRTPATYSENYREESARRNAEKAKAWGQLHESVHRAARRVGKELAGGPV